MRRRPRSRAEMQIEEGLKLVPRYEVHAVVEIDVSCARNDDEFLRLRRELVSVLAEHTGMRLVTRDEQHRTGRDLVQMLIGPEQRHLRVAGA